ncbi:MAG: hypothetical protein K2P93_02575 [Alphaproteobacteria bacterium]|nr:hypothetical protein [Alphaproteobacteria bacterium]
MHTFIPFKKSLFMSLFSLSAFLSTEALYGMQGPDEERIGQSVSIRFSDEDEEDSGSSSSTSSEDDYSNFSFDTTVFKAPLKRLISQANAGDLEAQETVATLLFEHKLSDSYFPLIETQNWTQVREKMETDPKFLYLAYNTKGHSDFRDYFETFYANEEGETNPHKIAILALMYQAGLFREDIPNLAKATTLCERAILMKDDFPLFYNIAGDVFTETVNVKKGQECYERGERLGDLGCMYSRAIWHQRAALQDGIDEATLAHHKHEASQRFEQLERIGYTRCYRTLATLYNEGTVLPHNPVKSLYYSILAKDPDSLLSIAPYLTPGDIDMEISLSGNSLRESRNPKSFEYSKNQLASKSTTPSVSPFEELIYNNCVNLVNFEERIQECFRILKQYKEKNAHGLFLTCVEPTPWLITLLSDQEETPILAVHTFRGIDLIRYGDELNEGGAELITVGSELVPLAKYLISLFNKDSRKSKKEHELNESESPILTFSHAANVIKALKKIEKNSFDRACVRTYRLTEELRSIEKTQQDLEESGEISQKEYLEKRLVKTNLELKFSNQVLEKRKEALQRLKKEAKALKSLRRRLEQFVVQEAFNPSFIEEYEFLKQLPQSILEDPPAELELAEVPEDPAAAVRQQILPNSGENAPPAA